MPNFLLGPSVLLIALISGLIFSGVSSAILASRKGWDSNRAYCLRNALSSFFTEYRRHPGGERPEYPFFETDWEFMGILLGERSSGAMKENPKAIAFYSDRPASGEEKMIAPDSPIPVSEWVWVWSAGPDGDFETWEDNIKTW